MKGLDQIIGKQEIASLKGQFLQEKNARNSDILEWYNGTQQDMVWTKMNENEWIFSLVLLSLIEIFISSYKKIKFFWNLYKKLVFLNFIYFFKR